MKGLALGLLVTLAAACGDGPRDAEPLVVLAAASLTAAFADIEQRYEAEHPEVDVQVSFAGSQVLAAQVREGAPADVLVTADEPTTQAVRALVEEPVLIARNSLAVVHAPGNPLRIATLADLARPDVSAVLAGPRVPAGALARAVLAGADVELRPVSEEPDVAAVVARVRSGEVDAGLAYATDLRAGELAGQLDGFVEPGSGTSYPASVVRSSTRHQEARGFVAFLLTAPAQTALSDLGFQPPP